MELLERSGFCETTTSSAELWTVTSTKKMTEYWVDSDGQADGPVVIHEFC